MEEKFGRGSHQILKTRFYFHKERGLLQKLECTTNGQKPLDQLSITVVGLMCEYK